MGASSFRKGFKVKCIIIFKFCVSMIPLKYKSLEGTVQPPDNWTCVYKLFGEKRACAPS